jgi:3-methylfumaryl-CoA hydratase
MDDYTPWIGREEVRRAILTPGLLARWCAMLDRNAPADSTAPQGLHWCLCTPDAPTAALGPDGHPRRDDGPASLLPPLPLERRMWAAGAVEFAAPIPSGSTIARRTRVLAITEKQGGTGPLVFAELAHETFAGDTLAIRETQTLVYRDAPPPGSLPTPPPLGEGRFDPAGWDAVREVQPGAPLLFRYSALTFNTHRIHYDHPYATGTEGYRGLVVHGPLIATLLLDLARRALESENALARFSFRAVSPAVADEPLHLALRHEEGALVLAAHAADGRQVMAAKGTLAA